jgi:hypothetical protein
MEESENNDACKLRREYSTGHKQYYVRPVPCSNRRRQSAQKVEENPKKSTSVTAMSPLISWPKLNELTSRI